jgi:hypothetical protein
MIPSRHGIVNRTVVHHDADGFLWFTPNKHNESGKLKPTGILKNRAGTVINEMLQREPGH